MGSIDGGTGAVDVCADIGAGSAEGRGDGGAVASCVFGVWKSGVLANSAGDGRNDGAGERESSANGGHGSTALLSMCAACVCCGAADEACVFLGLPQRFVGCVCVCAASDDEKDDESDEYVQLRLPYTLRMVSLTEKGKCANSAKESVKRGESTTQSADAGRG